MQEAWREHHQSQDPFYSVAVDQFGCDLALSDPNAEDGSDLAVMNSDFTTVSGMELFDQETARRIAVPFGTHEIYVLAPEGLIGLDGEIGFKFAETVAEPRRLSLLESLREEIERVYLDDPLVASAEVGFYIDDDQRVIFQVELEPIEGEVRTSTLALTPTGIVPV